MRLKTDNYDNRSNKDMQFYVQFFDHLSWIMGGLIDSG